jgi:thymidylate synthase ThyX
VTINFAWQGKYAEALLELNREELPRRIEAAEKAIYQRLEELKHAAATSAEELWAINDALRGLRVLAKTECPPQRSPEAGGPQTGVAS